MKNDNQRNGLRELQLLELDMLKEIIEVCNKLGIVYYASNGTLLGAIRHQGYIPWDDDIDISLTREDYEKFIREAPKYLPEHLEVKTFRDSEDDAIYTARVIKKNTKLIIRISDVPRTENVWIDLWALDGMPSNKFINRIHRLNLLYRRMIVQMSKYEELVHQHRKGRPWYERAIMKFCEVTKFGRSIDTKSSKEKVEKIMRKYDLKQTGVAINFWSPYKFKEEVPSEWYGKGKDIPFENIKIHIPNEPEKILEHLYGDYMKLPPESERNIQHCMEIVEM